VTRLLKFTLVAVWASSVSEDAEERGGVEEGKGKEEGCLSLNSACMSYEEEDACMSYEEEDACMSYGCLSLNSLA